MVAKRRMVVTKKGIGGIKVKRAVFRRPNKKRVKAPTGDPSINLFH